ncbi:hypothetical protein HDU89_008264 [Geranomyces variabilis]|nr:hypothetical protein HDU89_008264 [Geranomyces variabilis]
MDSPARVASRFLDREGESISLFTGCTWTAYLTHLMAKAQHGQDQKTAQQARHRLELAECYIADIAVAGVPPASRASDTRNSMVPLVPARTVTMFHDRHRWRERELARVDETNAALREVIAEIRLVVDLRAAAEPQAVTKRRKEDPETEYESSDDESDLDGVPKAPKAITLKVWEKPWGRDTPEVRGERTREGLWVKLPDVAKLLDRPVQGLGKVVAGNETLTTKHTCKSGKITRSIRFLSVKGLFRVAGFVSTDRAQELYDWAADFWATCKTSMGLAYSEPGSWLVVKAGKAVDLNDRLPDHRREFGNYPGATLTVKALMITERSELSTAENAIHAWLHGAGEKVEPKARRQLKDGSTKEVHKWSEIFVLPANKLTKAVQFMAAQQAHYCKESEDLRDHINNLQAALKDKDNKFEKMQEVALALAKK